jgi:hypothetical protein
MPAIVAGSSASSSSSSGQGQGHTNLIFFRIVDGNMSSLTFVGERPDSFDFVMQPFLAISGESSGQTSEAGAYTAQLASSGMPQAVAFSNDIAVQFEDVVSAICLWKPGKMVWNVKLPMHLDCAHVLIGLAYAVLCCIHCMLLCSVCCF